MMSLPSRRRTIGRKFAHLTHRGDRELVAKIPGPAAFFKPIEKPLVCLSKWLANPLQPKYCRLCNLKRIDLTHRAQSQHRRLYTPVVQGDDELLFDSRSGKKTECSGISSLRIKSPSMHSV